MARGPPPPMSPGQFAPLRPSGGPPQPFPVPPQFGQQPMGPPPPAAFRCSNLLAQTCLLHRIHKTSNSSSGNELGNFFFFLLIF
ncbi:hypothetical protein S83_045243 [Arachis hypogaea]